MKYVFYTVISSPHQLPWCREFIKHAGEENFLYLAQESFHAERTTLGWQDEQEPYIRQYTPEDDELLENCQVLITSIRCWDIIAKRNAKNLKTVYMFERWFKPPVRAWRLLHPKYLAMFLKARKCCRNENVTLLPIGVHAAQDMARFVRPIFPPKLKINQKEPMAKIPLSGYRMYLWGYFVEGAKTNRQIPQEKLLRVLWCGRMLNWKRVDTIIEAVKLLLKQGMPLHLELIGTGEAEAELKKQAENWIVTDKNQCGISFHAPVKITEIRSRMQENTVYILSSDECEGWGAVVNEAMAEGMIVIGTHETGSSATMIQNGINGFGFNAGKTQELVNILKQIISLNSGKILTEISNNAQNTASCWSPENAAEQFWKFCKDNV